MYVCVICNHCTTHRRLFIILSFYLYFQEFCLDLYQPSGSGRRKRSIDNRILTGDSGIIRSIISPVQRWKRNDGYDQDRQRTITLSKQKGKGEAYFVNENNLMTEKPRRHFYPIPLDSTPAKRENDRKYSTEKDQKDGHEEADINENVSLTVIMPEGNIN